jgi:hypothetical protein
MYDDTTLDVALNQFQANKSHISLVQHIVNTDPDRDPYPVTTGVVTMEVRGCFFVSRCGCFFNQSNSFSAYLFPPIWVIASSGFN